MPTVDAEALRRIDEISETFEEKQEELENIVNRLNDLIEGSKKPSVPKETKPSEDAKLPTKEGEFNIRDYIYQKEKKGEE